MSRPQKASAGKKRGKVTMAKSPKGPASLASLIVSASEKLKDPNLKAVFADPLKALPAEKLARSSTVVDDIAHLCNAEELQPYTFMDDAGLRRLGNSVNPETKRPWIPKPERGRYPFLKTVLGAAAWWRHRATAAAVDHPVYADMEEAEARGLLPRDFQKFAKSKGVDFINLNRTVKSEPLRRFAADLLKKLILSDLITHLEEVEGWDSDRELAKLRREQRLGIARENAVEAEVLHKKSRVEDVLWNHGAGPLRAGLLNLRKTAFAQVLAELEKAETPAATRETVNEILSGAVDKLLLQIRHAFPKRLQEEKS